MNGVLGSNLAWLLGLLIQVVIVVTALIFMPRRRKPTAAMAWLLLIVLFPLFGILFYLLIGNFRLPKKRRDEQARIDGIIRETVRESDLEIMDASWPRWFQRVVQQNEDLTGLPASRGNEATLLGDYQGSIDAMAAEIDTATSFVHVEFFIVGWDDTTRGFFSAMERAVARGVSVRLLADHISSAKVAKSKETFAELDRIGVKWAWMLPVMPFKGKYQRPDLRNHRKLVVVDGRVAFMGSQNLIARDYDSEKNIKRGLKWQELMTRLTGPVVAGVNTVFLSDWLIETGERLTEHVPAPQVAHSSSPDALLCQVVPSGPGYPTENNLRLFLSLIYGATEKVILTSPYFVPGRGDGLRDHDRVPARARSAAVRLRDRRPGARLPRAAVVLQRPARGRGADLPLPGAVHPARQALLDRRRHRRDRVEQHGHPLVQPQHGVVAARARASRSCRACARSSSTTGMSGASSRSRSGTASRPRRRSSTGSPGSRPP